MMPPRPEQAPPFAICDLDHIVLRAADVEALVGFYVTVLGCVRERTVGDLTQLRAGQILIDIVPRRGDDRGGRNVDHFCLTLSPFDPVSITIWLEACGVAVGELATRYGAGGFGPTLYLDDPEGNGLELRAAARATEPASPHRPDAQRR